MQLFKLNATESTNQYLKNLASNIDLEDYTTVVSNFQTKGRGQFGEKWYSERGKNLLISVLKKNINFRIEDQFYLNMRVTLSIYMTLKFFKIPNISIKWPNDILSCDKKISGVLIQLITKNKLIKSAIIGVGLNVNQTFFENLPKATSMKLILNKNIDLEELRLKFTEQLKYYFSLDNNLLISKVYHKFLYGNSEKSCFKAKDGSVFQAEIIGVSFNGNLKLATNGLIKEFDLKSIEMIY